MCGIVGYTGFRDAYDIVVNGLKRLEYRGYDSAGIVLENAQNKLELKKTKGKVSDLEEIAEGLKILHISEWDTPVGQLTVYLVTETPTRIFPIMVK